MTEAIQGQAIQPIAANRQTANETSTETMREQASTAVLPVTSPESERYSQLGEQQANEALQKISEIEDAIREGRLSPENALSFLQRVQDVGNNLEVASNATHSQRMALRNQTPAANGRMAPLFQAAKKKSDGVHQAITQLAERAEISEQILRNHAAQWREMNATSRLLLELEQLMDKYADRETLDLDHPENATETRDFARMQQLRSIARNHGVLWDQNGWNQPQDFSRFKRGVGAALSAIQSDKMMKQIEIQHAQQSVLRNWLTVTTMLKAHAELLREIARNMRS